MLGGWCSLVLSQSTDLILGIRSARFIREEDLMDRDELLDFPFVNPPAQWAQLRQRCPAAPAKPPSGHAPI